jgi:hypothetical protein
VIASLGVPSIRAAGIAGNRAIVAISIRSKVVGRVHGERPRIRLTATHTTAIQAIVTAIPIALSPIGQSGRVPQSRIVPRTSHNEMKGAARASIAGSEL